MRGDGMVMTEGEVWESAEGVGNGEGGWMATMENETRRGDFGGGAGDGAVRLASGVLEGDRGGRLGSTRVVASLRGSERLVSGAGAAGVPGAGGVAGGASAAGGVVPPMATVVVRRMRVAAATASRIFRKRCRAIWRC